VPLSKNSLVETKQQLTIYTKTTDMLMIFWRWIIKRQLKVLQSIWTNFNTQRVA